MDKDLEDYRRSIKAIANSVTTETLVKFKCEHCGCDVNMRAVNVRKKEKLLCNSCHIKYSKSKRTPEQKEATHKKTVETCLKKYGTVNGGCSEIAKQKAKETWKKNWGSEEECFRQRAEKAHNTFIEKYNGSYSTPEILSKKVSTLIKNYGSVENSYKERTKKVVETNRNNRGGIHNFQNISEMESKMIDKYGVKRYAQNKDEWRKVLESHHNIGGISKSWKYDNIWFDSFWEVMVYKYFKDRGNSIEYQPKVDITYTSGGVTHNYYPDFKIDGQLYEVKGGHFFNADGEAITCRGHNWTDKLNAMRDLNVTIITSENQPIKDYNNRQSIEFYQNNIQLEKSLRSFKESCRPEKYKSKTKKMYELESTLKLKE